MTCTDVESAKPIAMAVEIRPEVHDRAQPTTGEPLTWVLIRFASDWSAAVAPLGIGARPLAATRIVSDEPMDPVSWLEYAHPWSPKGAAEFVAKKMEWPRIEFEY